VTVLAFIREEKKIKMMECFTVQSSNKSGTNEIKLWEKTKFGLELEIIRRIYVYQITYQIRYLVRLSFDDVTIK
jgi:hypothetical protein